MYLNEIARTQPIQRSGVLGKLAEKLPVPNGEQIFHPIFTAFNYTNICNARCAMCLEDANHKGFPPFSLDEATKVLTQIADQIQTRDKGYLHLWGGEPFIDLELLYGIIEVADKLGFNWVEVATNGFWGKAVDRARIILSEIRKRISRLAFSLQISCDNFHNLDQVILNVEYLANIIYLVKTEFSAVAIRINCVGLKDFTSQHNLAAALGRKIPDSSSFFDARGEVEQNNFIIISNNRNSRIPTSIFSPSMSGRCNEELSHLFSGERVNPNKVPLIRMPLEPNISIGVDRQFYISLQFTSPCILSMGDIGTHSVAELVARVEADPIAVSLLKHGYSEIYPNLKEVFPQFDLLARRFYSVYDILKGLEVDNPFDVLSV